MQTSYKMRTENKFEIPIYFTLLYFIEFVACSEFIIINLLFASLLLQFSLLRGIETPASFYKQIFLGVPH